MVWIAHRKLMPFWLNSCKSGLHGAGLGQCMTIRRRQSSYPPIYMWLLSRSISFTGVLSKIHDNLKSERRSSLGISGIHITQKGDTIIKTHYWTKWTNLTKLTRNITCFFMSDPFIWSHTSGSRDELAMALTCETALKIK